MKLLTPPQVAEQLGMSANSVRELCKQNAIRHHRIGPKGKMIKIPEDAVGEYLRAAEFGPEKKPDKPQKEKHSLTTTADVIPIGELKAHLDAVRA